MAPFTIMLFSLLVLSSPVESQNPALLPVLVDVIQWFYNLIFSLSAVGLEPPPDLAAEIIMEPTKRINMMGYPAENHTIVTSDGYRLNFYRIPNTSANAIPVMLMHGLSACSDQFIIDLNNSHAFHLYNHGFDVWIGNYRGSIYSNHTTLTPDQPAAYYNFSFEEMAEIDLPTSIDYILNNTGKSKVAYIGHSMGTLVGFCFFSSHPEYNDKVSSFTALSPVPKFRYSPMLLKTLLFENAEVLMPILEAAGQYSINTMNPILLRTAQSVCFNPENYESCELLYFMLVSGWNPYYHNQTRLPIYMTAFRGGFTTKTAKHFNQAYNRDGLYHYDYGAIKNQQLYNSPNPPEYVLTNIEIPVFLYFGPNDMPSTMMDVQRSMIGVPSAQFHYIDNKPMYNHMDVSFAQNNSVTLYNSIATNIRQTYS